MKIALVLDDSIDRPDGVQQYVRSLGAYLTSVGHDVHYVCSVSESTDPAVHSLARNAAVTFNGNGLRTPLPVSRRRIRAFLDAERFDVIHVQTPHSPVFAGVIVDEARKLHARSVRIVATFHILPHGRISAWGTRALGVALRRNLRRFDTFAAVSTPAAQFAKESFDIDCRVIPIGIDVAAFATGAGKPRRSPEHGDPLVVSFLGRLVTRKGVLELIDAVALLPADLLGRLEVRIGGKGPLLGEAEAAIAARGLADVVTMVGFVSEEAKPRFYADADVAVFPATGGESFGIVLIEAMASGAGVVLAGANPGYLSVIGDRPEVSVDASDAEAFAAALERLLTDDALRGDLHAEQAERIRGFDQTVVGARVLTELYDR